MLNILNLRLVAIMSALAVVLSGGCGGPAVDPWVAPPADYYKPLDSIANATSTLGGVGIRSNDSNADLDIAQASGTLVHNTGALNYDDGLYALNAPTGLIGGTATDDTGGSLVDLSSEYAGTYEYVMPVEFNYTYSGVKYTTIGFTGVTTDAAHVPVGGSFTYTGDAAGQLTSTSPFSFVDWVSTIYVDFGAGNAVVTLEPAIGAPVLGPFDEIQITGMTVLNNTFTGGELATLLDGVQVNPIGTITSTDSLGVFFGWDSDNAIPDEVGGVSIVTGETGDLLFLFVGD